MSRALTPTLSQRARGSLGGFADAEAAADLLDGHDHQYQRTDHDDREPCYHLAREGRRNRVLTISHLVKTYSTDRGPVHAVRNVSFEVPEGAFYTLLGPSGCGKTTTLRCIAGLERA